MTGNDRPETRLATRLSFLAAGFAMACWAPLVPFAKRNVGVDEAGLGLLLLCLGVGAVAAQNPAVAEGAFGQAYGGAGQSGVTGKETIADAAHTRLELYQPGFRGAN